jgi:hypothetical protein
MRFFFLPEAATTGSVPCCTQSTVGGCSICQAALGACSCALKPLSLMPDKLHRWQQHVITMTVKQGPSEQRIDS